MSANQATSTGIQKAQNIEYINVSSSEDDNSDKGPKKSVLPSSDEMSKEENGRPLVTKKRKRDSSPTTPPIVLVPSEDDDCVIENVIVKRKRDSSPGTAIGNPCPSSGPVRASNLMLISSDPKIYWRKKGEMIKSHQENQKKNERRRPCVVDTRIEKLVDKILPCGPQIGKDKAELSKERYSNLISVFLILFKIPDERRELRPDIKNSIVAKSPGVSFLHDARVISFSHRGREMWKLGDEPAVDSGILKMITTHVCPGVRASLKFDNTMLKLWQSLLLRCPRCVTASSLSSALWKVKVFLEHEAYKKGAAEWEAERKKKEEEELRKALERLQKEREVEAKVTEKLYNNLSAFFLNQFKIPRERTVLRPDNGDPVVSYSAWTNNCKVRAITHRHGNKEIWQMGDERPMDSALLKKITTHRCPGFRSILYTSGTMLDLWHSLLLHCPRCSNMSSLSKAMRKVSAFIESERSRR